MKLLIAPTFYMALAAGVAGWHWGPAIGVLTWIGLWWSGFLTSRFSAS